MMTLNEAESLTLRLRGRLAGVWARENLSEVVFVDVEGFGDVDVDGQKWCRNSRGRFTESRLDREIKTIEERI
jgi:hypothetical protein